MNPNPSDRWASSGLSGNSTSPDLPVSVALPASLTNHLRSFRRRVWSTKMLQATLIAACGILGAYLTLFVIDRLSDPSKSVRALTAFVAWVLCALVPWFLYRWVWRYRRQTQLATLIARRMPTLGDQLLGVIELSANRSEQARSPELCLAAIQQGAESVEQRDLRLAAPSAHLRLWACVAVAVLIPSVVLAAAFPDATANAWQRLIFPWKTIPRCTFADVEPLPATLIVPHGEPFEISCRLRDSALRRPTQARFRLGSHADAVAPLDGSGYDWTGPPLIEPAELRIDVGDWRQIVRLDPKHRPELTALVAQVDLPEYLGRRARLSEDARSGSLRLVRGSRAALTATINRTLASAAVAGGQGQAHGAKISVDRLEVDQLRELELRWQDEYGLDGKAPFSLTIHAEEDAPPTVTGDDLPSRKVLLDSEQLLFRVSGRDDFGVRELGITWRGLSDELAHDQAHGERLIAPGDPERPTLEAQGTFSAASLGIVPQPIELRLYAVDYFPGRERVYSSPFILYVLSAEDHAIWVTEQLSRWHRQSLEVRDRELRLYETNQQLRNLSADELDLPETRREIEKQAAAERANGQRLSSLTQSGAELLRTAARNPQIGVGHLDQWAEMLKILEEIASQRMPSVADLLKEASQAEIAASRPPQEPIPAAGITRSAAAGPTAPTEPKTPTTAKVPQIADVESSQQPTDKNAAPASEPKNASAPTLRLPATTLIGSAKSPPQTPSANPELDQAVDAQRDLLAEFEKVANELNTVLANLEGSTLVKRLKAASRKQYEIAGVLGEAVDQSFGRNKSLVERPVRDKLGSLASQEEQSGRQVSYIMDDLQAYFERRQLVRFKAVLDDMRSEDVLGNLRKLADEIPAHQGLSIAQCEYWSDAMDRWAEDLVDPACSGQCPGCRSRGSLPPSIVLEVLKVLEGEVNLREETRGAEQARPGWESVVYSTEAERLANAQVGLAKRVESVVERIEELPEGSELFAKEIALLDKVDEVMDEAAAILASPATGATAVAAETEAIELLLQSRRINPSGGGGGGSSPGGGGGGEATDSALALLGAGQNPHEVREQRAPSQTTGETGASLPEEFRAGLDRYFSALEEGTGG